MKNTQYFFLKKKKEGRSQDTDLISKINSDNKLAPFTPVILVTLRYVRARLLTGNDELELVHIVCVVLTAELILCSENASSKLSLQLP